MKKILFVYSSYSMILLTHSKDTTKIWNIYFHSIKWFVILLSIQILNIHWYFSSISQSRFSLENKIFWHLHSFYFTSFDTQISITSSYKFYIHYVKCVRLYAYIYRYNDSFSKFNDIIRIIYYSSCIMYVPMAINLLNFIHLQYDESVIWFFWMI